MVIPTDRQSMMTGIINKKDSLPLLWEMHDFKTDFDRDNVLKAPSKEEKTANIDFSANTTIKELAQEGKTSRIIETKDIQHSAINEKSKKNATEE